MSGSFILRFATIVEPIKLESLFPVQRPVEIELGAGDGSFLAAYAQSRRETNFIAVERLLGRLRKIDRKARRAGLDNVRLFRIEAAYFIRYLTPPGSARAIHIYFPDPWPKRRHWKNRLVTAEFADVLERALVGGGSVFLRTDDRAYFEQMLESFAGKKAFEKYDTPPDLLGFVTDFERTFQARGVSTLHASYRKI
jgi:tRNA (guanine-N7-)-methyltransferase